MNQNWIRIDNITEVSAKCPKCGEIFVINHGDYDIFYDSELTDKILKPLCCEGFWAVWKATYNQGAGGWRFYMRTGGKPIGRDPFADRSKPVLFD